MLSTRCSLHRLATPLLAAALGAQATDDILVSTQNVLRRHTAAGALVSEVAIPYPIVPRPITESARDLVVHASGDVYVFNGTFTPYLSVRRAATGTWQHFPHPQWTTANSGSYGGIALYEDGVFVTGSQTALANGALLRFDIPTATFTVFATPFVDGFLDLAIGWDGLLYALSTSEQHIEVFDATTLQHQRTITLPFALGARGLGVAADGTLLVATWQQGLRRFDGNGNLQQVLTTGSRHHDLDLDACERILCGDWGGRVIRSDSTLTGFQQWTSGATNTFVAFAAPTVPAPAVATVRAGTPPNPTVFSGPGARLGTTWTGTLAPFLPGALFDVVIFGAGPANVPLPFGTYLVDENVTHFVSDYAAGGRLSVALPDNCMLTGFVFVAQAGSVSWTTCALANALDVRISSF